MRVRHVSREDGDLAFELLDNVGEPIQVVSGFLRHLLLHFFRFLERRSIGSEDSSPPSR